MKQIILITSTSHGIRIKKNTYQTENSMSLEERLAYQILEVFLQPEQMIDALV